MVPSNSMAPTSGVVKLTPEPSFRGAKAVVPALNCKEAVGELTPTPTFPFNIVLPVPDGVRVTSWFAPPAANVNAPVPVMDPVVVPVPPLATGTVPEREMLGVVPPELDNGAEALTLLTMLGKATQLGLADAPPV